MASAFTADLHLKLSGDGEDSRNFRDFLNGLKNKDIKHLYILGDLFTYWYEHPKVDIYAGHPAFRALKNYSNYGGEVYFLKGNRDFMAGSFFKKHSGADFIGNDYFINTGSRTIYLTHGDKLAKKDIKYRIWSAFIRFPLAAFIFKRLPVETAVAVADKLKQVGKRKPSSEKVIAEMMTEEAVKQFRENCDIIIAGHAHYRVTKDYIINKKKKTFYILPEFKYPGEFLVLNNKGGLEYRYFN